MNSSRAAVTRFLAASCGSRSPGSAGVVMPRSRDVASTTIAPARISQAAQAMRVIAATARVPSSGLVSASPRSESDGSWFGSGFPPRFEQGGRQADDDADQQHRRQQPGEPAPERGHRSTPSTARTIRDSAEPVTGT